MRVPAEEDFTSRLREPCRRRPDRDLARRLLRPGVRHRPDQPLRPGVATLVPVPGSPDVGLPGHPGSPRHLGHGGDPAAAGEAVDGVPEAADPSAPRAPAAGPARPGARLDRGAGGGRHLPARLGPGQLFPVVPVGLRLHPDALRDGVGGRRCARRTRRGEAADRTYGACGRRGLRRTRPADHGKGGRSADPARTTANHVGGHRRGRARHSRRDGAGAAPRVRVRGPVRGWSTGRAGQPVCQGCRRRRGRTESGLPPHRGVRRARGTADSRRPGVTPADDGRPADRLCRGLERRTRPGPASACANCWIWWTLLRAATSGSSRSSPAVATA